MAAGPDDSAKLPVGGEAVGAKSAKGSDAPGPTAAFVRCLDRIRPVLQALLRGIPEGQTLVVAAEDGGFPVAQRVLERPEDLPGALVVGRHNRCSLAVPGDRRMSLRHLLLVMRPGLGARRFRAYDLGGRAGLTLADGAKVSGASFRDQGLLALGRTVLFVLPGGLEGISVLEGTEQDAFRRLTGLAPDGSGTRRELTASSEPGVAYLDTRPPQEFGGYRGLDLQVRSEPRGMLVLRTAQPSKGYTDTRTLEVDSRQLQRGLLIGRYSDRCSLAGEGRNLSRVHALVAEEGPDSLLVYDLASTNGVRPGDQSDGPTHPVVRMTAHDSVMLGHFELTWEPGHRPRLH